ncbi:hypothetical protein EC12188_02499 [Escherichia coli O145:H28]|uniref:DUF551 domain-containing protein n=1 Tax=Salmonella enterica TaxID=28901 RepID=UPI000B8D1CE1|nr:DUF551 domain-containing protein [Salmonella enterica]ASQ70154.1 DUF551 domain containing protein [Escherichia coli NCCP15648]GDG67847.1 hypothetical protein BvCmsKKP044_03173 [Escherichia coli]GEE17542.1 hypothetical protein EC12188_02499 [Escherichia coli O145:H28]GEF25675.1 hypothetical protein EC9793_05118 [Escherichia coli O145:H28]
MITITNKKQYPSEQYLNELITNIEFAARAPVEVVRAMAAELQKRREADSAEPVAYIFKHPAGKLFWALTDESNKEQADVIPVYADSPAPVLPDEIDVNDVPRAVTYFKTHRDCYADGWNACRAAMLQSGNFRENKNSSTNNFREIAETSTNYPVIPSEVLSAILKVAKIRADFDDFDGDRRGIGDCLDEAEQELIVTINKYASQLAAEPIATNDVREQTAVPPVPVIQADVAQAIEKLKRKLVECNRYNYCADAVKGVEYACHAAMLQGSQPVSQTYKFPVNTPCQDAPAHIWLQTAGVWPEDGELSELTWCSHNQHHDDTLYVRADLVNGNSPVTPDSWISCSERMPNDKQYVWCWGKSYGWTECNTFEGYYDWSRNKWWAVTDDGEEPASKVTHWMLLPEPPQEAK